MSTPDELDQQARTAAFYQAGYQAWFATRLEAQKAVFTLASIAFGVCATLVLTRDLAPVARWVFLVSGACFCLAMIASIRVFMCNSDVVKENLRDGPDPAQVGAAERSARQAYLGSMFMTAFGVFGFALGLAVSVFGL
jgi:hypothetical protein